MPKKIEINPANSRATPQAHTRQSSFLGRSIKLLEKHSVAIVSVVGLLAVATLALVAPSSIVLVVVIAVATLAPVTVMIIERVVSAYKSLNEDLRLLHKDLVALPPSQGGQSSQANRRAPLIEVSGNSSWASRDDRSAWEHANNSSRRA